MAYGIQRQFTGLNLSDDSKLARSIRKQAHFLIVEKLTRDHDPDSVVKELAFLYPGQEKVVIAFLLDFLLWEDKRKDYYFLAMGLCRHNLAYSNAFENYLAEQCKKMQETSVEIEKLKNMAIVFAELLKNGYLSWDVLAHLCMQKSDMSLSLATFARAFFEQLSKSDARWIQKLTDPTVLRSIESVYPERGSRDTLFFIDYFESLRGFNWIPHTLRMRLGLDNMY